MVASRFMVEETTDFLVQRLKTIERTTLMSIKSAYVEFYSSTTMNKEQYRQSTQI